MIGSRLILVIIATKKGNIPPDCPTFKAGLSATSRHPSGDFSHRCQDGARTGWTHHGSHDQARCICTCDHEMGCHPRSSSNAHKSDFHQFPADVGISMYSSLPHRDKKMGNRRYGQVCRVCRYMTHNASPRGCNPRSRRLIMNHG